MKKKIILNWMPPAMVDLPSPPMSILKQYLVLHGFDVNITYWNLILNKLQTDFLWTKNFANRDIFGLNLFFNYLSIIEKDQSAYNRVKVILKTTKPQYLNLDSDFFDNHMHAHADKVKEIIDNTISNMDFSDTLLIGMSVNLYQWICSSIIAKKIKEINPSIPIVIGGIGTKYAAKAYLENFPQFDFALWGEGENSLTLLAKALQENENKYDLLPNLVYRDNGNVKISPINNKTFIDLADTSIRPDYSDYFQNVKKYLGENYSYSLPIEGSRGCHWNKCHFCYLNMGYKYRVKSINAIINELEFMIQNYSIYKFQFLDNDVIGKNLEWYDQLLDSLITLKDKYPDFTILLAEIITKGINSSIIKKMSLAGYIHVQIGYESASDELLKKMDKKNTFSSNLLFVKFATLYRINIGGANILKNLLEETDEDIQECIDNLHSLRFFLNRQGFVHNHSQLGISHSSRYYKQVHGQEEFKFWEGEHPLSPLLPRNYIIDNDPELFILEGFKCKHNKLWDNFALIETYYLNNKYEYEIIRKNDDTIIYIEYYNKMIINQLEFSELSLDWFILKQSNNSVRSIDDLLCLWKTDISHLDEIKGEVVESINQLRKEKLLFHSKDYSEIVSIINTELLH